MQISSLESAISIVIVLFLLSSIVEKITQLIRNYAPFRLFNGLDEGSFFRFWQNIGKKKSRARTRGQKRVVEREVDSLSLMIGILIAILFHVDLIRMLRETDPRDALLWSNTLEYKCSDYVVLFFSLILTGFFLTFGSKFFHDLLDILYATKKAKEKIEDKNTFEAESLEEFDAYIAQSQRSIIESAIAQNPQLKTLQDAISPPMHGKCLINGRMQDCIDIQVTKKHANDPKIVKAKLDSGQLVQIPVNIILVGGRPKLQSAQGDKVSSGNSPNTTGTICCKLQTIAGQTDCLLTCSHVMTGGDYQDKGGELAEDIEAIFTDGQTGTFFWAACNEKIDAALFSGDLIEFEYKIKPKFERILSSTDLHAKVRVVRQDGRGIIEGRITNVCVTAPMEVENNQGDTHSMVNLIILSRTVIDTGEMVYNTLTDEGDSGACVYDSKGHPIAMIVAGNSEFSYAISLPNILKKTKTKLLYA